MRIFKKSEERQFLRKYVQKWDNGRDTRKNYLHAVEPAGPLTGNGPWVGKKLSVKFPDLPMLDRYVLTLFVALTALLSTSFSEILKDFYGQTSMPCSIAELYIYG